MRIHSLSDGVLADMGKNIQVKLEAHEVGCFNTALADDLAAAIGEVNNAFEAVIEESVAIETAKRAVFQSKRDKRALEIERINTVLRYLKSVKADKKYYDMLGLPYRKPASAIVAAAPTGLAATGRSNGMNNLVWTGNNRYASVVYQVWYRHSSTADWGLLNTTKKQRLTHTSVVPGQFCEYKVCAQASSGAVSVWSNTAVVYGGV